MLLCPCYWLWLNSFVWVYLLPACMVFNWQREGERERGWRVFFCNNAACKPFPCKCMSVHLQMYICVYVLCAHMDIKAPCAVRVPDFLFNWAVFSTIYSVKVVLSLHEATLRIKNNMSHLTFREEINWFWLIVDYKAVEKQNSVHILFSKQQALRIPVVWADILDAYSHRQSPSDA